MTIAVMSALVRPLIETQLPPDLDVRWFMTKEEAMALAPIADIGWFDMYDKNDMAETISAATNLKWLNSIYAGIDGMPIPQLRDRGVAPDLQVVEVVALLCHRDHGRGVTDESEASMIVPLQERQPHQRLIQEVWVQATWT